MKVYIPILHVPNMFLPACGTPKSISVTPWVGNISVIFKDGILKDLSHPYEFSEFNLSTVGISDLAVIFLGEYPPAVEITSIICKPFSSSTLLVISAPTTVALELFPLERKEKSSKASTATTRSIDIVVKVFFLIRILRLVKILPIPGVWVYVTNIDCGVNSIVKDMVIALYYDI